MVTDIILTVCVLFEEYLAVFFCFLFFNINLSCQDILIPTMDTGAEVANRFYKELTDIQVLNS